MIKGLKHMPYEERLIPGAVYSEEEKAGRGCHQCLQIPEGWRQEDGTSLFSLVPSDRTKGNGDNHVKFSLNIRKKLYCEAVQSSSLEIFKTYLDLFLCDLP